VNARAAMMNECAARKCAQSIICAYSDRKTGIHFFAEYALANSPEYLEISKHRKAGAQGIVLLAKGLRLATADHHHGPKPNPRKNGAGTSYG
jgi:hypothetical protein